MKKFLILLLAGLSFLFAAEINGKTFMQTKIPAFYKSIPKNYKIYVQHFDKNLNFVTIKADKSSLTLNLIVTDDGKYVIIPRFVLNGKTKLPVRFKRFVNKKTVDSGVDFIIKGGKKTLYLVTDPECPFCRKLIKSGKYKDLLKKYTLHIIIIPISYHPYARQMTFYILSAKTVKGKIKRFINVLSGKDKNWRTFKISINKQKEIAKQIRASQKAARELGAMGTPSAFNKNFYPVNPFNAQ